MKTKKSSNQSHINRRRFLKNLAITTAGFTIVPRFVLGGKQVDGTRYVAPSDMIGLGFIGAGKQGKILSNRFLDTKEIRITALSEVYNGKADLFKSRVTEYSQKNSGAAYSDIPVYQDYRELLTKQDVDAVVISTPDYWHAAMAVRAAEAGKDIYCEKPLSLTIKEGRAMVAATRKNNRVFQTGSMQRSWPEFRQAVELVRNNYIGDIKTVKVNVGGPPVSYNLPEETRPDGLDWNMWLGPNAFSHFNSILAPPVTKDVYPDWRLYKEFGGGDVTDWGAHMFDIVQWALDKDDSGPVKIFPPDGKEYPFLTLVYDNGITVTHEQWDWNNAVHFIGTTGEIKVGRNKLETSPLDLKGKVITESEKHVYKSENHYTDFLNAMRTRTKPVCDVEIGHRTATVCNLANIAYQLKRPLVWNPKEEKFKKDKEATTLLGRPMLNEWAIEI